jgi:S1-C subfamily serine protease
MTVEKLVVSSEELSQLRATPANAPPNAVEKLPSPVPLWARLCAMPLVLVLPLLAIVAFIVRIAFRAQPRNVRYAWVSFLSTLLIVSSLLSTVAAVVAVTLAPLPAFVNSGLSDLDEREKYTALPASTALSSSDASEQLKPLVVVISPVTKLWRGQEVASPEFGAGALLLADKSGFLFATARHVVNHGVMGKATDAPKSAMVATASGIWSSAQVVATAADLDLALVWVARHSGSSEFVQPIVAARDGEGIFVIGHPEGMKFTLSTGIVSSIRDAIVQVSAAISPGNSGGPVYDEHGNLIGIFSSKFDRAVDPNAENLGFATRADAMLDPTKWVFAPNGKQLLECYTAAAAKAHAASLSAPAPTKP